LVGDATMRRLNADWAGEDHTTDVLAFPRDGAASAPFADAPLGDIVINWDAVCRQASGRDEAARIAEATALMVHGLAHLHGHDHARRGEGRRMLAVERMILRRLGVADVARPYGGD
jgi:probable rRNA maturation factor